MVVLTILFAILTTLCAVLVREAARPAPAHRRLARDQVAELERQMALLRRRRSRALVAAAAA